jgi:ATP-dependent RNA helicase RhlE
MPAQPATSTPHVVFHGQSNGVFASLIPALQRAVSEEGYTTPTPIQEQTIAHVLAGRDILGCAQTGTGKTAAFTLPLLQRLSDAQWTTSRGRPRALILAPTRELALQIGESIRTYGRHLKVTYATVFGGVGQGPQVAALHRGVDIVVATPGRLLDLMQQRHVRLDGIEVFVLDEADRMLDMGFIRDIRKVIGALPPGRQSLFFSATLTGDVVELARSLVRNPVHVTIQPERPAVERIAQKVLFVDKEQKVAALVDLLRGPKMQRVLVFVRMKHAANRLVEELAKAGIAASAIHGNKSQGARTEAMDGFRSGRIAVLVATDLAARGIDVDGISHVVNFDLPEEPETYVHRIGRTARAGADGDAVSLCCRHDRDALRAIERFIRTSVPPDLQHPRHSDSAMRATGADARLPPRGNFRGGGARHQGHPRAKVAHAPFRGTRSFGPRR